MPARKDKSVKTSLTQEDYDNLVKFCEKNDETMSQVIRKAIKEYLNGQDMDKTRQ